MKTYTYFGLGLLLSFLAGKYLFPPAPQVKERIKTVTVEKIVERRNVTKKTTITEKKDGTKVTDIVETDKTVIVDSTKSQSEKKTEVKGSAKVTLGVLAIKQPFDMSKPAQFGVSASVPVFGNVRAMGLVTTEKQVGLGLGMEF